MTCAFCGCRDATHEAEDDGRQRPCCERCDAEVEFEADERGAGIDGSYPLTHRVVAFARRWEGRTIGEIRDALEISLADQDRVGHALLRAIRSGYLVRDGKRGFGSPGAGYTYSKGPRDWKPGRVLHKTRAA